jgi:hypothetical protein
MVTWVRTTGGREGPDQPPVVRKDSGKYFDDEEYV